MSTQNEFLYQRFKDIEKDDLEYIYRGNITPKLVMNILDFAKSNLAKAGDTQKIKSKIYYIMGEGLQNITRHQAEKEVSDLDKSAIIVIHKKHYKYYIATGNLMNSNEEQKLTSKLDFINKLDETGLKEYSKEIRLTTEFSERGGASLGLIEMAKKSGNKLSYKIEPIDEKVSYFYLNTEITTQNSENTPIDNYEYSLDDLIKTHNFLNKNNHIISFKGDFNQENLLSLLTILKNRMSESTTSIKLYAVMVELLQNIVKHADSFHGGQDWKAGIFNIADHEDKYTLSAGNYIKSNSSKILAQRLDALNSLTHKELTKEYNRILLNSETNDPITIGLGIIDIRRKCGSKVEYQLIKVNNDIDFLTINIDVNKTS